MNQLAIFEFEAREVRAFDLDGEVWFLAKDVCRVLELKRTNDAIERLDEDEKLKRKISASGQNRDMWLVNESGLYSMTLTSNKPEAKKFKRWITFEVLPSIRKAGGYGKAISFEEMTLAVLKGLGERLRLLQQKVEEDLPKVEFFEAVTASHDCVDIGEVARILRVPNLGRNRLFVFLRQHGVLMHNNQPFQRFIDRGYFRVIEQAFHTRDGEIHVNVKTVAYQSGVSYIRTLLHRHGMI